MRGVLKPGGRVTLDYKATALSGKGGRFDVETVISQKAETQTMRTLVEVEPPQ